MYILFYVRSSEATPTPEATPTLEATPTPEASRKRKEREIDLTNGDEENNTAEELTFKIYRGSAIHMSLSLAQVQDIHDRLSHPRMLCDNTITWYLSTQTEGHKQIGWIDSILWTNPDKHYFSDKVLEETANKSLVLFPICHDKHWQLLSLFQQDDLKIIVEFCSLGLWRPLERKVRILEKILNSELQTVRTTRLPLQELDTLDCGIHLCHAVDCLLQQSPTFPPTTDFFDTKTWFAAFDAKLKRLQMLARFTAWRERIAT